MALPDVTFTNNLGTLTFKRALLGFSDQWEWAGRSVKRTKRIDVDATVLHSTAAIEGLDGMMTNTSDPLKTFGQPGTLTLPWTVLNNVRLTALQQPDGNWAGHQQVQATFEDDRPDSNAYTVNFFGVELHNPRLSVELPHGDLNDEYTQMDFRPFQIYDPVGYGASVLRTKSAPNMMSLGLTGTMFFQDGVPPTGWVNKLVQRANMDTQTVSFHIPPGWPRPFHMVEACPELAIAMPLTHLITVSGRLSWNVETASADISIEMVCQPQRLSNS